MLRRLCCIVLLLAAPATAVGQDQPLHRAIAAIHPTDVDVLLATQAVLHTADMVTTSYALTLDASAREANPLLAPFTRRPVALVALSGAIDVLLAYSIARLQPRHPKVALWSARALVGVETWSVINNVNAIGELQRRRAIGSR